MKTLLIKLLNYFLRKSDSNSQFVILSRSENITSIYVNGKKQIPVNFHSGKPLNVNEKYLLEKTLDEYFAKLKDAKP